MILFNSNLRDTPKFTSLYLFLLVATLAGCVGTLQTMQTETTEIDETNSATETEESPRPLVELQLSTPKTKYAVKDAIPLELNIQNGKFDLLVPFFRVATKGAFMKVTVKGTNGQIIESKRAITQENPQKYVMRDGKSVRCVQGFELKASSNQELVLKDLQRYYQLQPGTYTITLAIELEVYRESITEEHPEVLELKRDLARLQKDPNLQAAAKQDALNYYQEQIKFVQEQHKEEELNIYLPVKSRRGKASLVSNSITLTVEPETKPSTRQIQDKVPSGLSKGDIELPRSPPELEYFTSLRASGVVSPKFKTRVNPKYPKSAKEARKGGEVLLETTIDENGIPKDIVSLTNLGYGLEEAAIEALKKTTFQPAMKGDKPVSMQIQIPYAFTITDVDSQ